MKRPFPADVQQRADALLARDFLYDSPASFRAGVIAAMRLLAEQDARSDLSALIAGATGRGAGA